MSIKSLYSQKVTDHFMHPRNMGTLKNPSGVGKVGNPVCGDVMELQIAVENDKIKDVKFQTFGCGAAIATSSIATEMIKEKSLKEAGKLTNQAVAEALGGLPQTKMHCSVLAAEAVKKAIEDYRQRV